MSIDAEARIPAFTRGDRIRKAIEASGHKVGEVAAYLQCDRGTVSNWMHDKTNPSPRDLMVLATYLDVPLEWLRDGVTDKHRGNVVRFPSRKPHADLLERIPA